MEGMQKASGRNFPRAKSRHALPMMIVWMMFSLSLLPTLLLFSAPSQTARTERTRFLQGLPLIASVYEAANKWYSKNVEPVQELRALAPLPMAWEGRWIDFDKNYAQFERWYGDHLGLRDLMIRTKNEVDYRLFHSSSRVYFGKSNYIYGRNLVDTELPATETLLNTPESIEAVHRGLVAYAKNLQNEGITPIFIAPMQKEYLVADNLPFFAPRQSENSHFMALYNRLLKDPEIHLVDVFGILSSLREKYPIYYTQDFHWTDMSALAVASSTTNLIASLEKSAVRWDHPIMVEYKPTIGSDARFAARLNTRESVPEPELVIDWKSTHTINTLDAKQTGLEFESSMLADTNLLPPTCMYGNSFSDGMLRAGLADYYQKFTKLDRSRSLQTVPDLIKGRCKYVIIQILDIQTAHWASLRQ